MNIFVLSHNRTLAAAWLDDKRANKMVVESLQLLSTTVNELEGGHYEGVYKSFNPNHPCRLWVGQAKGNFVWLLTYTLRLLSTRVPPQNHEKAKAVLVKLYKWYGENHGKLPNLELQPFVNCAANSEKGVSFKDEPDTVLAYQKYLNARWAGDKRPPTWKTGLKPDWYQPPQ